MCYPLGNAPHKTETANVPFRLRTLLPYSLVGDEDPALPSSNKRGWYRLKVIIPRRLLF
jgi:hypothetical protein